MIEYLIGVDGGGTGTRVRLACADGTELGHGTSGPSGLGLGIEGAWAAVCTAVANAFRSASLPEAVYRCCAIGLGLAGVHNKEWAAAFIAANPGFGDIRLEHDGLTTLLGAHGGMPGAIVAVGTGSVGQSLLEDGTYREVGGWGFPSGDEASGGWIGLRAVNHIQRVLDGRLDPSPFAHALIDACGGGRDAVQVWLGDATQTRLASLAPIVAGHAATDPAACRILEEAAREVAAMARALDPSGTLPLALCGGLGPVLRHYLPDHLRARAVDPKGDSASGALRMMAMQLASTHRKLS